MVTVDSSNPIQPIIHHTVLSDVHTSWPATRRCPSSYVRARRAAVDASSREQLLEERSSNDRWCAVRTSFAIKSLTFNSYYVYTARKISPSFSSAAETMQTLTAHMYTKSHAPFKPLCRETYGLQEENLKRGLGAVGSGSFCSRTRVMRRAGSFSVDLGRTRIGIVHESTRKVRAGLYDATLDV